MPVSTAATEKKPSRARYPAPKDLARRFTTTLRLMSKLDADSRHDADGRLSQEIQESNRPRFVERDFRGRASPHPRGLWYECETKGFGGQAFCKSFILKDRTQNAGISAMSGRLRSFAPLRKTFGTQSELSD
jgi:hypothetical protein